MIHPRTCHLTKLTRLISCIYMAVFWARFPSVNVAFNTAVEKLEYNLEWVLVTTEKIAQFHHPQLYIKPQHLLMVQIKILTFSLASSQYKAKWPFASVKPNGHRTDLTARPSVSLVPITSFRCLVCSQTTLSKGLLSKVKKIQPVITVMSNDVILFWHTFVLPPHMEKDIPSGCCLVGCLPVTRLMWHPLNTMCVCDHSCSEHMDDKVTGVSKQPPHRPVLSQTEGWEQQRRCLVSSASSARYVPASSHKHVWWWEQARVGRLIWF